MHTIIVIIAGLVLLGLCLSAAHMLGGATGMAHGALAFLPLWLTASGINMYVGVRGGRPISEEVPFLLLVFAIPVAAAFFVWWKLAHGFARRVVLPYFSNPVSVCCFIVLLAVTHNHASERPVNQSLPRHRVLCLRTLEWRRHAPDRWLLLRKDPVRNHGPARTGAQLPLFAVPEGI